MLAGGSPDPEREYLFAAPDRMWRFDFAWPAAKVAVEIEGGLYRRRGGHVSVNGFMRDCEKYNAATVRGWAVLRYTERDLAKRPVQVIEEVANLVRNRSQAAAAR